MRRADLLSGILLLALSVFYFERSFAISAGLASDRLGPTFFPRVLAVLLALLATSLIARAASGRSSPEPPPPARVGKLFAVLALAASWTVLLPGLGFLFITPLVLAGVIWTLGFRRWRSLISVAVGVSLVLYLVFAKALHVLLPTGLLGGLR